MKQKIRTEKVNIQTTEPKANASVFLFFANPHFFKTILAHRRNGTFDFSRHTNQRFKKPKEPFFANALQNKDFSKLKTINKTI